jgi:hypothetical protein
MRRPINRLDWEVLNALSDDYESVEQIVSLINGFNKDLVVGPDNVIDSLEWLHQNNLVFLTLNKSFDRAKLESEITNSLREYWFGRTEEGLREWERHSDTFCGMH